MDPSEIPPHSRARIAISHTTLVIDANAYIIWLSDRLRARGVHFVRATVPAIADVHSGAYGPVPDVVVNATGLGAKTLGGVVDADVEPIRCAGCSSVFHEQGDADEAIEGRRCSSVTPKERSTRRSSEPGRTIATSSHD